MKIKATIVSIIILVPSACFEVYGVEWLRKILILYTNAHAQSSIPFVWSNNIICYSIWFLWSRQTDLHANCWALLNLLFWFSCEWLLKLWDVRFWTVHRLLLNEKVYYSPLPYLLIDNAVKGKGNLFSTNKIFLFIKY